MIGISGSLIWSKTLMEVIFNPCSEFRWSPGDPVSQIHSPHLHDGGPGIFSDLLRSVQLLNREWCAESNGKLPHLFILYKTATLVPKSAVEDLPLGRTAALVPKFAVKDLPFSRTLMMMKVLCIRPTYTHHGRFARWIKWRACDVGEAKEELENELWRRQSNGRVGEWAVM